MIIGRRSLNIAITSAFALSIAPASPAVAADYPTRPVSIISPAPAGSGPDVIARIVADRLTGLWGKQVVIANRPGAGGLIGMQAAAAAKPDGYTLYMPISSTFIVLPETRSKLPLNLERDLLPVGLVGEQPMVITVNPKLGVDTLPQLIASAKKHPGSILYGANLGSLPNLAGELLQRRAGFKLTFVPYPNMAKATQDAIGGTTQLMIESFSGLAGPIGSGLLKALAVASAKRVINFPDLPTVAEAVPSVGLFEAQGWFALTALAGTPDAIVQKVSKDLRTVLAQPDLHKRFAALGTYPRPMSPRQVAAFIHREQELWRPMVRDVYGSTH